jgi:hypothetical protein
MKVCAAENLPGRGGRPGIPDFAGKRFPRLRFCWRGGIMLVIEREFSLPPALQPREPASSPAIKTP